MNFKKTFLAGSTPTLNEVLAQREKRVAYSIFLLSKYPNYTIITLKLNIPGPIKNNFYIKRIFDFGRNKLETMLDKPNIIFAKNINEPTGPESFIIVSDEPFLTKKLVIDFESSWMGRLFDADITFLEKMKVRTISREDMKIPPRKCFVCDNNAKVCASRRVHTIEVLQEAVINIAINGLY